MTKKNHQNYPAYQDSPLKKINLRLLNKINKLEKKYSTKHSSMTKRQQEDITYAKNRISDIKTIITMIDKTFAPAFNKGKKPSRSDSVEIGWKLPSLITSCKHFIIYKGDITEIFIPAITHPMMFELIEMATIMSSQLPLELSNLIDFFDPASLSIDNPFGIELQLKQVTDAGSSPFDYKLTVDGKSLQFNLANEYTDRKKFLNELLLGSIIDYFNNNLNTPYVKSERFRISVMSDFFNREIQSINQLIVNPVGSDIDSLATNEVQLKKNQTLIKQLNDQKTSYADTTIESLLQKHPGLTGELQRAKNKKYNTLWTTNKLPTHFIGEVLIEGKYSLSVISITSQLNAALDKKIEELNMRQKQLKNHIAPSNEAAQSSDDKDLLLEYGQEIIRLTNQKNSMESQLLGITDTIKQLKTTDIPLYQELIEDRNTKMITTANTLELLHQDITTQSAEITDIEQELTIARQKQQEISKNLIVLNQLKTIHSTVEANVEKIPLKEINECLKQNHPKLNNRESFKLLLALIDQSAQINIWNDYLDKQGIVFNSNTKSDFDKFKESLLDAIKTQIQKMEPSIEDSEANEALCLTLSTQLNNATKTANALSRRAKDLSETITEFERHRNDAFKQKDQLELALNNHCQEQQQLTTKLEQCISDITVLWHNHAIQEQLLLLQEKITQCLKRDDTISNKAFAALLQSTHALGDELGNTISELLNDYPARTFPKNRLEEYQATLEQIMNDFTNNTKDSNPLLAPKQDINIWLKEYQTERSEKYVLKDWLISNDKTRREQFIKDLKTELEKWYISGDSRELMRRLQQGLKDFPGHHLSTVINQIIVKISHQSHQPLIDNNQTLEAINTMLEPLESINPSYVTAIKTLYQKVETMGQYGEHLIKIKHDIHGNTMRDLAKELNQELNYFVTTHQNNTPTAEDAQLFMTSFKARLHSKDDLLNQHTSWKPLALNIAIAIGSVGIALGIQLAWLAWSKITTGRFCFFFEQQTRHKHIDALDKQIDILPTTAATP